MPVSGNLVQTNEQILTPVLENTFFNQRLALPVTKERHLVPHSALIEEILKGSIFGELFSLTQRLGMLNQQIVNIRDFQVSRTFPGLS